MAKSSATKRATAKGKLPLPASVVDGYLSELGAKFAGGDVNALFRAIAFCGKQQVAMPAWVVDGYFAGMSRWWTLRCATLDEAFGVTRPKGRHIAAARKRRDLEVAIFNDVTDRVKAGASMNDALLADIGKKYGIGKTRAWEYYKHFREQMQRIESPSMNSLLVPHMTPDARQKTALRKISKLSGVRSKRS